MEQQMTTIEGKYLHRMYLERMQSSDAPSPQYEGQPNFFPRIEEPAAWFSAGGMLLMLVGALSLLRVSYGGVAPGVKWLFVAANLMLSAFWLAMLYGLFYKFVRYPASFVAIALILVSSTCSRLNPRRRSA